MIWLAALGGGAFVLVSLVLGPRLLILARRTGQLPEFTMGLCLLLMGGLGYPFATLGRAVTALPDDVRGFLLGCAALCNTVGFAALAVFTWRVFRPGSRAAEALVTLCLLALALELADAVDADRVRLWAIAMAGASVSYTTSFTLSFLGIDLASSSVGAAIVGSLGLVSATSAWLAFLPPAAYLRRVSARPVPALAR